MTMGVSIVAYFTKVRREGMCKKKKHQNSNHQFECYYQLHKWMVGEGGGERGG